MRVSVERMPGSTVAVDIFSDEAEFSAAVDKAYRKINRDIYYSRISTWQGAAPYHRPHGGSRSRRRRSRPRHDG